MTRTVLVTGASTGIGRATALRLDSRGWRVLAGVRKESDGEALRAAASERLQPLTLDVTNAAHIEAARDAAGDRLDALVNNAGITVSGPVELVALDDFRRQIDVNLLAQVAVTQAMLPALRAASGRLVFISSVGGRTAVPFAVPYNCSKFAIEALGDALRVELRKFGIKVALIEPGSIDTPIWEKGLGEAEDFLASFTPEQAELYGPEIQAVKAATEKVAAAGISPDVVAKRIEHAVSARRPKTRYVVGRDARVQIALRSALPDRAWDRVLSRAMALP